MLQNQKLKDNNGYQVALFPLEVVSISQGWYETFSHDPDNSYATDLLGRNLEGGRVFRAPCYAPVDIKLLWTDVSNCCALWQSLEKVHFADNTLDYLGIIVYHDNDIENGTYSEIGTVKLQGEIFNRTGTGGKVTGDHVHLETGKGEVNLNQNKFHFLDTTDCKRIVPDEVLFVNDTIVNEYPRYNWKIFEGGVVPEPPEPTPTEKNKNIQKWFITRNKKILIKY